MKVIPIRVSLTNCYILKGRGGTVLVDTPPPGGGSKCIRKIEEKGLNLKEITLIAITHGHFDHTGSADYLREATGAEVLAHNGDVAGGIVGRRVDLKSTTWGKVLLTFTPLLYRDLEGGARVSLIMRGEEMDLSEFVSEELIALHTPGHTPGSITLLSGRMAFAGDLVMNGPPFTLRPRIGIFAEDPHAMQSSFKEVVRRGVRLFYPGHGKPFEVWKIKEEMSG